MLLTKFNANDPVAMKLLDDVLESLTFKNGQAQKVDGQISEFMHPDAQKAQDFLNQEAAAKRKLNCSAVMHIDRAEAEHHAPEGLVNLFARHGVRDNKKPPMRNKNRFYEALTKEEVGTARQSSVAKSVRPAVTPPKVAKLDLTGKVTGPDVSGHKQSLNGTAESIVDGEDAAGNTHTFS